MKTNLKPRDRVVHNERGFGQVIEVFSDGSCWVRWNGGYESLAERRDLKRTKSQPPAA